MGLKGAEKIVLMNTIKEKTLFGLLNEPDNRVLPVLQQLVDEAPNKRQYCLIILEASKHPELRQLIFDHAQRWSIIKEYCKDHSKRRNWLFKNDFANLKWIITTTIALTALYLSYKKTIDAQNLPSSHSVLLKQYSYSQHNFDTHYILFSVPA